MLMFRNECIQCSKLFVMKILERAPIKYKLTKALTCLNPEYIRLKNFNSEKELKVCLDLLLEAKRISANFAEKVAREYQLLCSQMDIKELIK